MDQYFEIKYSFLIPLLPLVAAMISGFFGARWLKEKSHWPIWIGVGAAAILAFIITAAVMDHTSHATEGESSVSVSKIFYTWADVGDPNSKEIGSHLHVDAGFFFDPLTCVMMCVVFGIGFFITVFAAGYMKGEEGYFRFFAYLGLFLFSMGMLVMGENLILLYLGWEGVGLCSYLLIGYYYDKPAAREAAKKAFLVNRVGDFGFGLGIMLSFLAFGTVSYFGNADTHSAGLLTLAAGHNLTEFQTWAMGVIPFLLMIGAFGKSAQFPLYVWLPDAMEGPTPVSALIHAATMVTAGIYMIARCAPLFVGNAGAMQLIATVGVFTALFAATIALRQVDLKKVFAYSTISQLGFMFVGVGVLAPTAAVFHLITHAFFKALLFLSSGVVMHAMMGHLDMRKMSGLKRVLPKTNILMLIGCAALAGFPFTSGFFSKDEIVAAAGVRYAPIWIVALITAFMTAYYTFRLYFRVFQGPTVVPDGPAEGHGHADDHGTHDSHAAPAVHHGDDHGQQHAHGHSADAHGHGHHNHEPMIMIFPLIVLAIGALFAGGLNWPGEKLATFLGHSPSFQLGYEVAKTANQTPDAKLWGQPEAESEHHEESWFTSAMATGACVSIAGILLAYYLHLYNRELAGVLAGRIEPIVKALDNKYWVDQIYQAVIVEPLRTAGQIFFAIDKMVIDGLVNLIGFVPQLGGFALKISVQRGYLQGYAAAMLFGVITILLVIFMSH